MQIVFKMNDVVNDKSLNLILDDADKKEIAESKAFRDGLKNVCDLLINIETPSDRIRREKWIEEKESAKCVSASSKGLDNSDEEWSELARRDLVVDFEHDYGKFERVVFYMKNGFGNITIDRKDSDSKTFTFNVEDRKLSINELGNIVGFINDTKEQ